MAEESKRRRGRRGGGRREIPQATPETGATAGAAGSEPESEEPRGRRVRFRVPRLRRGGGDAPFRSKAPAYENRPSDLSPMDFWRSGSSRSLRPQAAPKGIGPSSLWRRVTGLYFPPWVPVVGIIVIVFGVLGLLFFTRSATGAPRIGQDHWHAPYQYIVCGERQPNFPTWEAGVHTHGDGIIHIHPFTAAEEGSGSRLVKWFQYGGGSLTGDSVRAPGSSKTYKNGDKCKDGSTGVVQVFANGAKLSDYSRYIPHDGDQVRIVFGPKQDVVQQQDRIIIGQDQATRTINMTVAGDNEGSAVFEPSSVEMNSGETVKIVVKNVGAISHGMRIAGVDGKYLTSDDFLLTANGGDPKTSSGVIPPGKTGFVIVRFDNTGQVQFRDDTAQDVTGQIVVRQSAGSTPAPTGGPQASNGPQEAVDVTLNVSVGDSGFSTANLTVKAGQKFRITLKNDGQFAHNLRIDGPDGQFRTSDDLVSPDVAKGDTQSFDGKFDKAGTYHFRDDYHQEFQGTITVE